MESDIYRWGWISEDGTRRDKGRKACNIYDQILLFSSSLEGQIEETILSRHISEHHRINKEMYADGIIPNYWCNE